MTSDVNIILCQKWDSLWRRTVEQYDSARKVHLLLLWPWIFDLKIYLVHLRPQLHQISKFCEILASVL